MTPPDEGALVVDPAGERWVVVAVERHYGERRRVVSWGTCVDPVAPSEGRGRRWVGWREWHDWRRT